ncbi:MAG TPA: tetratricopeptide repeat protein, partial [Vicinamibacterales bacterium]
MSAAVLLFIAVLAAPASAQSVGRILVMPFDTQKREARVFWLGEAASVLLTDNLTASGANPISRVERLQAFERLQVPPVAALTDATVIRIGQLVGADRIVTGTLSLEGDILKVRARSIALDAGRVQLDATETGQLSDLYVTFRRLAVQIAPGSPAMPASAPQPPVAAFESYIKGLLAETPATAIDYLNAALRLQPGFDRARLALWDVYADQGEHERALATLKAVGRDSAEFRRARFLAGLSQLELRRYDDAFASFRSLADERAEPAVMNNLGVVQLRRSASASGGRPTFFFDEAAKADPADADFDFNLGYAYWTDRDYRSSIYWLREAVRRRPTDGIAHYVLGAALAAAGNSTEAVREKELARRLSSEFTQWDRRPATDPIPRDLERVKNEIGLPAGREILAKLATSGQRDQQELARFYLESAERLYARENDREAAAELGRALYLSPYLASAHLLLGRIHVRNGRMQEAIEALKISIWSEETAAAHAVLGEAYRQERDLTSARAEADRALAIDSTSAEAKALLARLGE